MGGAPPDQVIAHTNLYWTYQTAPGRTAGTVETKDVDFGGAPGVPRVGGARIPKAGARGNELVRRCRDGDTRTCGPLRLPGGGSRTKPRRRSALASIRAGGSTSSMRVLPLLIAFSMPPVTSRHDEPSCGRTCTSSTLKSMKWGTHGPTLHQKATRGRSDSWERLRYDWSEPGVVKGTVIGSNIFKPGSTWEIRAATRPSGRTEVELIAVRHLSGVRGRLLWAFLPNGLSSSRCRRASAPLPVDRRGGGARVAIAERTLRRSIRWVFRRRGVQEAAGPLALAGLRREGVEPEAKQRGPVGALGFTASVVF